MTSAYASLSVNGGIAQFFALQVNKERKSGNLLETRAPQGNPSFLEGKRNGPKRNSYICMH